VASTARDDRTDVCSISWSFRSQGLDSLIQLHYQRSWSASGPKNSPWVLCQGTWMCLAWCTVEASVDPSDDQSLYTARF
jgi:hypothetical protein